MPWQDQHEPDPCEGDEEEKEDSICVDMMIIIQQQQRTHLLFSFKNCQDKSVRIEVRVLGKHITFDVENTVTTYEVKSIIYNMVGVPIVEQNLSWHGVTMADDSALVNYDIGGGGSDKK